MAKTKQKQTQKKHLIRKEVSCDQWISKKKEPKCTAVNKLRALFGSSVQRNPLIEVQFSSQPLEIKQTKQTTLNKYFINQDSDKSPDICQDSPPTSQSRDNNAKGHAKKECTASENSSGIKSLKRSGNDKLFCHLLYTEEDESESDIFEENDYQNIRCVRKGIRQSGQRKSHKHASEIQQPSVKKEQFGGQNNEKSQQNDCTGVTCSVLTPTDKTVSGSTSLSKQCNDEAQSYNTGSYQDTVCPDKMLESCNADDGKIENSTRWLSSEDCSSQCSDKRVSHKMSVLDAVEEFAINLKMVKEQVLSDLTKSKIRLDSHMQPLTFHVPESSSDPDLGSTLSCDLYFKETQSQDWGRFDDSESCDLTFHIPEEDLIPGIDHSEMLEDSQLSNLTFH